MSAKDESNMKTAEQIIHEEIGIKPGAKLKSLRDQLAGKEKHYAIVEKSIQQAGELYDKEIAELREQLKQREEEWEELKEVIKELIFHLDTRNVPLENTPRIDLVISKARKLITK